MNYFRALPFLVVASGLLVGCATLEPDPPKQMTTALAPTSRGAVAAAASPASRLGSGVSGFHLVTEPDEAMNWRLALLDHATRSVDIQYYQWANDEAGLLLFDRVLSAAERGVKVRILVDDFLYGGEEERLVGLAGHPNLDIRIYNPQHYRGSALMSGLEFVARFGELNRRMHNKIFLVDSRIAIMGGRNVGNYYYGLSDHYNMLDVDVLAAGPIVRDISASFDEYFNSKLAYPATEMAPGKEPLDTSAAFADVHALLDESPDLLANSPYPLSRTDWSGRLRKLSTSWISGRAVMLADDPVGDSDDPGERFLDSAPSLVNRPDSFELLFVSPYLVPTKAFYKTTKGRIEQGVDIRLLAPGLGSNNQPFVHSHYRQHRRRILGMGIGLHEVPEDGNEKLRRFSDVAPNRADNVALHAKVGVGDRKRCFIGSLNLDPRSLKLNSENGLFIESPALAGQLADHIEFLMDSENAWELELEEDGELVWRRNDEERRVQPGPKGSIRTKDFLYGLLPIKGLL
jgi:putative cardiolipin synthase